MKESIKTWLIEQFGDDADLHAELYNQYASDMKAAADKLQAAATDNRVEDLASTGHAMKGMALQMGDTELSEPCLQLQKAGQAADLAACLKLVPTVLAGVGEL